MVTFSKILCLVRCEFRHASEYLFLLWIVLCFVFRPKSDEPKAG
jgi:hypothetical protein